MFPKEVNRAITDWAMRHQLVLSCEREGWYAHVSSDGGDCFQMWIDFAIGERTVVHARFIEGPEERECQIDWHVSILGIGASLDELFAAVLGWMDPHKRHHPPSVAYRES
jgi:hypothetical protein